MLNDNNLIILLECDMSASAIIFYIISAFILGADSCRYHKKDFRSAIWLLFSLIGIAALYFWMQVEFIAAVQIVVYVGGIVVLIIFSIFLTQQAGNEMPKQPLKRTIFLYWLCYLVWPYLFCNLSIYIFNQQQNSFECQCKNWHTNVRN